MIFFYFATGIPLIITSTKHSDIMASATHSKDRDAEPKVEGEQRGAKSTVLETGAAMTQVR